MQPSSYKVYVREHTPEFLLDTCDMVEVPPVEVPEMADSSINCTGPPTWSKRCNKPWAAVRSGTSDNLKVAQLTAGESGDGQKCWSPKMLAGWWLTYPSEK